MIKASVETCQFSQCLRVIMFYRTDYVGVGALFMVFGYLVFLLLW